MTDQHYEFLKTKVLEQLNNMTREDRVKEHAERMLRDMRAMGFGEVFGPLLMGMRLSGFDDDEMIELLESLCGIWGTASHALEITAYGCVVKEDE